MVYNLRKLPDIPTREVTCTVTSRKDRESAFVYAYDYHRVGRSKRKERHYEVPLYIMTLTAKGIAKSFKFRVIRWGVVIGRKGDYLYATPAGRYYGLIWQDGYGKKGAWRLKKGSNALIHDTVNDLRYYAAAAGCIEVIGLYNKKDAFNEFNRIVRELSEVPPKWDRKRAHKLIQKNKTFNCIIQPALKPPLKLVE